MFAVSFKNRKLQKLIITVLNKHTKISFDQNNPLPKYIFGFKVNLHHTQTFIWCQITTTGTTFNTLGYSRETYKVAHNVITVAEPTVQQNNSKYRTKLSCKSSSDFCT